MRLCKSVSVEDFEVVETPGADFQSHGVAQDNIAETAEKAVETEPDEALALIDAVRRQVEVLAKKSGDKAVTHDRRVRTLEYCFDDCEAEIQRIIKAVEHVKVQIDGSAAKQEAQDALRIALDETKMLARDNSTRLDRMVVRYLPSVEAKIQGIKLDQEMRREQTETAVRDLQGKLDSVSPSELAAIRRIAAEANLRSRSIEQMLPELKSELFMALAIESATAQANARKDREETAREVERLSKEHMDMWEDARELSLRVMRTEEVAQHLTGTVVPLLEHRLQKQVLLLSCKDAEVKEVANAAEARFSLLNGRVQRLEEKLSRADVFASRNSEIQLRLAALESAVAHMTIGAARPAVPPAPPMITKSVEVQRTLMNLIRAEILRRAIRAELFDRGTRRQRALAERLSAPAFRAGAIRIAIGAELRRRERRRITPSSIVIRAACIRRELRMEIARRQALRRRQSLSAPALRAACIRREIRINLAKRDGKAFRRNIPSSAVVRAACIRRELRIEISKRRMVKRSRNVPFAAAIRAACIGRELRVEIGRRLEALYRRNSPSLAAIRAACIRRELQVEIGKRLECVYRRNAPRLAAIRNACVRRELRVEIAKRQELRRTVPTLAAIRAACVRRELRAEIARREEAVRRLRSGRIGKDAIVAEILRRAIVVEIARRKSVSPAPKPGSGKHTTNIGTIEVHCRTLTGDVALNIQVPTFVSVRYLKQLLYFTTGCTMHPSAMNLVYAGRVLEDCWKIGGGSLTAPPTRSVRFESDEFVGIQHGATVLIVVKRV